jgi:DNA polymerase III delta prime subunit
MEENNSESNDKTQESKGALEGMPPSDVMVIYPNPEKKGAIRLGQEEYMPLVTSRILFSGPPGSGKRNVILNLVRRMLPPPSVCHLIHCDPNNEEYDILSEWGIPVLTYGPHDFPTLENIEDPFGNKAGTGAKKEDESESEGSSSDDERAPNDVLSNPLVIVDEVTAELLGKLGCSRFERMVNHVCTHRNTTLLCSIQSAASIPPMVRRGFNHFALWKQPDEMLNGMLARRTSITSDILNDLFGLLQDPHEFIWIDLDSPIDSDWRYRVGLMNPIRVIPRRPGDEEVVGGRDPVSI